MSIDKRNIVPHAKQYITILQYEKLSPCNYSTVQFQTITAKV